MKPTRTIVLAALACAVAGAAAVAQQKVSGEKWRMKMSMQAEGFSMPARTTEMCLPQAEPEKAMMQQQQQGESNCAVTNFQQSGNKTSADIRCTGKDAMEGRFEMEQLSPTSTRGVMTGKTADTSMRMEYEYTKLGGACEVVDYSSYKPPAVAAVPQIDFCQRAFDDLDKGGSLSAAAVGLLQQYPNADGRGTSDCSKHANFPKFCAAVQTPAGFADLDHEQWNGRNLPAAARNEDATARMLRAPLTESLKLCKLDADAGGIQKLQAQMVAAARSNGQYGFTLYYAAAAHYSELQELAKKECSGRSFTNAANTQYLGLCRNYGAALVRNDRPAVLEAAGCNQEREDVGRGVCIGATSDGGTGAAALIGTASSGGASGGSSGSAAPAAAEAAEAEEPASAKDKAKDALDKGRKALRGIFGGG